MVGEIGLDGSARLRWPTSARHLFEEKVVDTGETAGDDRDTEGEWKRLTPFKTCMAHQRMVVEKQLEVAVDLGVNVSFHSVAAPGMLTLLNVEKLFQ